jgi:hypothetical protein
MIKRSCVFSVVGPQEVIGSEAIDPKFRGEIGSIARFRGRFCGQRVGECLTSALDLEEGYEGYEPIIGAQKSTHTARGTPESNVTFSN